jgi:hypothetical protein
MAANWKREIHAYAEREKKINAHPAALLCSNLQYTKAHREGWTLLEHVIDYLIGNPWNTSAKGREHMEAWHNKLSEAYPYGLIEYSVIQFNARLASQSN